MPEGIDKQANREVKNRNGRNHKQGRAEQEAGSKQQTLVVPSFSNKKKQTERQLSTILKTCAF